MYKFVDEQTWKWYNIYHLLVLVQSFFSISFFKVVVVHIYLIHDVLNLPKVTVSTFTFFILQHESQKTKKQEKQTNRQTEKCGVWKKNATLAHDMQTGEKNHRMYYRISLKLVKNAMQWLFVCHNAFNERRIEKINLNS